MEDNQNCSTIDVRTTTANQLSDIAIKNKPRDSHIQGVNHNGSFLKFTKITIAGSGKSNYICKKYSTTNYTCD